jgi:hypothetical protein
MRTTISINDALLEELKRRAAAEKRSFRKTLEETLQRGLAASPSGRPVRIEPAPIGVKKPYQNLSMNLLYDQLESGEMNWVAEP